MGRRSLAVSVVVATLVVAAVAGPGGVAAGTRSGADGSGDPLERGSVPRVTDHTPTAGATPTPNRPDDARLTVTDVTVSPSTPVVGDPVTLSVSLRNSGGSPSPVQLEAVDVYPRNANGSRSPIANATDLGTLSPGDTLTVPVTATFDAAGVYDLVVVARGINESGNDTRVRRPVTVVVERSPPQLEVSAEPTVPGSVSTVDVAVANPTEEPVRNLTLRVVGRDAGLSVLNGRRSIPRLAAGGRTTETVRVRAASPGEYGIDVALGYTTSTGVTASTNASTTVRVRPAERDIAVRVEPVRQDATGGQGGSLQGILGGDRATTPDDEGDDVPRRVEVTVTNFGTAPATGVVLAGRGDGAALGRRSVARRLAPGESAAVTVDLSTFERPTTVRFEAIAVVAGRNVSATRAYDYRPAVGTVRLTGLDLSFTEDGELQIEGNAGNVGGAAVDGVVLSVGNGTYVEPAYPSRSYFVGTVEASEFAPFELTADVDPGNVSAIPVTVEYAVRGRTVERTVRVPYEDGLEPPADDSNGPGIELYAGVVLAVAIVVGAVLWIRRRRRDES